MKLTYINGVNPFKSIPVTDEYRKSSGCGNVVTCRHRDFKLIFTCNEHCTSDKNYIVFETESIFNRMYYLVKFDEDEKTPDTIDYKAIVEELVNCGLVSEEDIERIKADTDTDTDTENSSEVRAP